MSTVAEFSIPADDFPLGHIFETLSGVTIEIERVVPTNEAILPYFWVRNVPVNRVQTTLEAQGALESFTIVDDLGEQGFVRARWNPDVEGVFTGIVETDLTVLSATGTPEEWRFEFRAELPDQIGAFQQYCADHGIDVELIRLHGAAGMTQRVSTASHPNSEKRYCSLSTVAISSSLESQRLTSWQRNSELLASRSATACIVATRT